jgi:hypothetical protein
MGVTGLVGGQLSAGGLSHRSAEVDRVRSELVYPGAAWLLLTLVTVTIAGLLLRALVGVFSGKLRALSS